MSDWKLVKLGFRGGVWRGRLEPSGAVEAAPELEVRLAGAVVPGAEIRAEGPRSWTLDVPVPAVAAGDGVAVFLVVDRASGMAVADFVIATGELAEDDLRAEVALLRAELDLMKRHFRRLARGE